MTSEAFEKLNEALDKMDWSVKLSKKDKDAVAAGEIPAKIWDQVDEVLFCEQAQSPNHCF